MTTSTYTEGPLSIEQQETPECVQLRFLGKSTARDPGLFIVPIVTRALELCELQGLRLELDFQAAEYLNSSSITPIIRLLETARKGQGRVRVLYKKELKWQSLSFMALEVFQTADGRIEIQGV